NAGSNTYSLTINPQPLNALRQQYGFYYGGSYYLNSSGMNEKWFLDANNNWYIITADGTVSRWNNGGSLPKVASADPRVWNDPTLLFFADLSQFLAPADLAKLGQLRQQY